MEATFHTRKFLAFFVTYHFAHSLIPPSLWSSLILVEEALAPDPELDMCTCNGR